MIGFIAVTRKASSMYDSPRLSGGAKEWIDEREIERDVVRRERAL